MIVQVINVLSDVVAVTAGLSALVFIATYTKLAPWWRDSIGLTLVLAEAFIFALFVSIFLHIILIPVFNDVPVWVSIVDMFIAGGVAGVNFWRCAVWIKAARKE
jgi:hypothetical protein